MHATEQALSSMASDGYSRLYAGAIWLVIHVYVRVHISVPCMQNRQSKVYAFYLD